MGLETKSELDEVRSSVKKDIGRRGRTAGVSINGLYRHAQRAVVRLHAAVHHAVHRCAEDDGTTCPFDQTEQEVFS
ncbi:hypothetical protein [Paenibacillus durus]|uniref:hypothetical protein n=1 Tax=Paenibacillus durus TaxID=44251 RepID=UPI0012DE594B|nr:hypothetical protein [Paenibacillus durus]